MSDVVRITVTDEYREDMRGLDSDQRRRINRRTRVLPRKGWSASVAAGDVAPLWDDIWELRVLGKGPAYRVLFFIHPEQPGRLVVLSACVAKSDIKKPRVLEAQVERAKRRRARWLANREKQHG